MCDTMAKKSKEKESKQALREKFQRAYLQLQLTRQYLNALVEERAVLKTRLSELAMTISSLNNLKKVKKGEEIWSTLGSNTFVLSDIKDISTAIVGVGAGIYVRKKLDGAIATLNARHAELSQAHKQLTAEIEKLNMEALKLEPEIQAMAAQLEERK